ncbi:MAG: L,D-transpeptidase [Chitinophagaceae bacterium]|nr:L,D-transpeptidase [Chitinophagaceae bacterium]
MKFDRLGVIIFTLLFLFVACDEIPFIRKKKQVNKDSYKNFKEEVLQDSTHVLSDTSNIFDTGNFDPNSDSVNSILDSMAVAMKRDSSTVTALGKDDSGFLKLDMHNDSSIVKADTFTSDIKKITPEEVKALKYNLEAIKVPDTNGKSQATCKQKLCKVWAHISKKKQRLYLYIDGVAVDTFKVSTGDKAHETPTFDTKPNGLMFQKYTSKKYPGGSYNGLGNMPYVVFIKGGFAIHGTTVGNFKKLGTKASHGCVRLHPDNAKLFFELVKATGPNDTWITISE